MNARGLVLAVALVCVSTIAVGQGKPSAPVNVTNDTNNPVPVQVTNSASNPLPVAGTVVAAPLVVPVQRAEFGTFATGSRFSNTVTLYTVPAGKLFVLQTVTIESNQSQYDQLWDGRFSLQLGPGLPFSVIVQPVAEGIASTGAGIFRKTAAATAYAGPGTDIVATGVREGTVLSSTAILFGISGQLIDAP